MINTMHKEQMTDVVELDEKKFTVWEIERIAINRKIREQYEHRYKDRLYYLILRKSVHR